MPPSITANFDLMRVLLLKQHSELGYVEPRTLYHLFPDRVGRGR